MYPDVFKKKKNASYPLLKRSYLPSFRLFVRNTIVLRNDFILHLAYIEVFIIV